MAILESNIWSSASDMAHFDIQKQFTINNISNEDGMIMIDGVLEGISNVSKYRVVSFTKDYFNIFYQSKSTYYNIKIKL